MTKITLRRHPGNNRCDDGWWRTTEGSPAVNLVQSKSQSLKHLSVVAIMVIAWYHDNIKYKNELRRPWAHIHYSFKIIKSPSQKKKTKHQEPTTFLLLIPQRRQQRREACLLLFFDISSTRKQSWYFIKFCSFQVLFLSLFFFFIFLALEGLSC